MKNWKFENEDNAKYVLARPENIASLKRGDKFINYSATINREYPLQDNEVHTLTDNYCGAKLDDKHAYLYYNCNNSLYGVSDPNFQVCKVVKVN